MNELKGLIFVVYKWIQIYFHLHASESHDSHESQLSLHRKMADPRSRKAQTKQKSTSSLLASV